MIMSEAYDVRIGRRVRHVDSPSRARAIVRSFYAYPLVTVEWEATGRESTENRAYLTPVFTGITVHEITDHRGRALRVTAYVEDDRRGERVVIEKWRTPSRLGHPAGTITYRRVTGPATSAEELEPERAVSEDELYPDVAALL